jgi:Family of unknown function (DUF6445)
VIVDAIARISALLGYIDGSDDLFEQIGKFDPVADRLIIYHGSILRSGIIPPGVALGADHREGRLASDPFIVGDASA